MSGTSLDGIDAALVRIQPDGSAYRVDLLNFTTMAFERELSDLLRCSLPPNAGTAAGVARLHRMLGDAFAGAAAAAAADARVDYIASHGQTLWHDGDAHVTLQLGDAFAIRERMHASVCYDFRSADCAAGGQGAPLVPYVDALLLRDPHEYRVAINIGGIANLSAIAPDARPDEVVAFDSGPGNMLIDAFVCSRSNGGLTYDRDGELALQGRIDDRALRAMLADPYFALMPPKTTGRERFGEQFLRAHGDALRELSLQDGAATLTALTTASMAEAVRSTSPPGSRVVVSGGGAHNAAILADLARRLPDFTVQTSNAMNIPVDAKEAIAFALLGYETLRARSANVARVTGARHPVVLGAIAPYDLTTLLAKMERECRA